jgi:hypothetical protein
MTSVLSIGPAPTLEDSGKEQAFERLKARYGEARLLLSPEGDCANLDWILGAISSSVDRSDDRTRRMIPLLALWLEDLAVELEGELARSRSEATEDSAAAARLACESAAATLRHAAVGFVAAWRREV